MLKGRLVVAMMIFASCSFISQISLAQGISIDQYKEKLLFTESRKIAKKNKVFDITATFLSPRFRIADAYQNWEARRLSEDQIKIEEDKLIGEIKGENHYLVSVTFKLLKGVSPKRLPVPDEFDKYVFLENDQGDFVKAELLEEPSISRIGAEDRAVFLFSFLKNKLDGTPLITDSTKYRKVVFTNLGNLGEDEARWELPVKPPYAPLEIAGIIEKAGLVEPRIRDSQMRLGIEIIQAAINSYAIDHRGKFPLSIDTATLGKYLLNEKIPENPYLKRPMRNTKDIGDFTYTVSKDRTSYSLKGNYHGDVTIKPPKREEAKMPHVTARVSNADDKAVMYVNGQEAISVTWGTGPGGKSIGHRPGDSGWVDITPYLKIGDNVLRFRVWNKAVCCGVSGTFEVQINGVPAISRNFKKQDSTEGVKYDETVILSLPIEVTTLRISARRSWTDTGIDLKGGEKILITAKGTWDASGPGAPESDLPCGPEGIVPPKWVKDLSPYPYHGGRIHELLGKIEPGKPFYVGRKYQGVIEKTGRLYLGINDWKVSDNDGYLDVKIEVER